MNHTVLMLGFAAVVALPSVAAAKNDDATFSVVCVNPRISRNVSSHGPGASGWRHAKVDPIQLNISQPATGGALLVDSSNHAVCTVKVSDKYKMNGATFTFVPGGTYDNQHPSDHKLIESEIQQVRGSPKIADDGRTMTIQIEGTGPLIGNVTIALDITYRRK
jgi:hypothetical protein